MKCISVKNNKNINKKHTKSIKKYDNYKTYKD